MKQRKQKMKRNKGQLKWLRRKKTATIQMIKDTGK